MNELETAARRFGILDHAPMGMCVVRSDFIVLFWNRCLENWTGIDRRDIVESDLGAHFPHLKSPKYRSRLETIFLGGPPAIFSSQLHSHIIPSPMPSGELRIQHTIATAVPAFEKKGFYALFAVQDVTELTRRIDEYKQVRDRALEEIEHRQRAEEELREANTMIVEQQRALIEEERLKVLLQMAGTTAHELNQPLMGLLGNIELMKMVKDSPERLARRLEGIEECGRRISEIVKRIQSIRHYATKPYLGKDFIINLDQGANLLVVADPQSEFRLIHSILADQPQFSTAQACNIEQASARLAQGSIDMILAADQLPDGNILMLLERIRKENPETPVVVIAAHNDDDRTPQVVAAGAFDHFPLAKVNNKTLPHLIISTLEKARIRMELKKAHHQIASKPLG
jgi:two-component system cell cycle response regulator